MYIIRGTKEYYPPHVLATITSSSLHHHARQHITRLMLLQSVVTAAAHDL